MNYFNLSNKLTELLPSLLINFTKYIMCFLRILQTGLPYVALKAKLQQLPELPAKPCI